MAKLLRLMDENEGGEMLDVFLSVPMSFATYLKEGVQEISKMM